MTLRWFLRPNRLRDDIRAAMAPCGEISVVTLTYLIQANCGVAPSYHKLMRALHRLECAGDVASRWRDGYFPRTRLYRLQQGPRP